MRLSNKSQQLGLWVLINTISWAVAFSWIVISRGGWIYFMVTWVGVTAIEYGAVQGAIVGTSQWLVLKRLRPITPLWIVLNIIGWSVAFYLSPALSVYLELAGIIPMCLIGIVQALLLRMHFGQTIMWCLSIASGWSIGWYIGGYIALEMIDAYWFIGSINGAITGAIYGLSTGIVLARLSPNKEVQLHKPERIL